MIQESGLAKRIRAAVLLTSTLVVCLSMVTTGGCFANVKAASARPELKQVTRVAVMGLSIEWEATFIPYYMSSFPFQDIIERSRLDAIVGEQRIGRGTLDDSTRARIRRVLGAQAVVLCRLEPRQEFSMRILDTETGVVLASVVTKQWNAWNYSGVESESLMRKAVDSVAKELNRVYVDGSP